MLLLFRERGGAKDSRFSRFNDDNKNVLIKMDNVLLVLLRLETDHWL